MIRTTMMQGTPKRRIAVIEIPRPQRARMGSVGPVPPATGRNAVAWTTISDEEPDSSANWVSMKLLEQARARETTPGTLNYTPASNTPAPNVAPWNSWLQPNCGPGATPAAIDAAPAAPTDFSKLWLILGLLGAAASAKILLSSDRR